MFRVFRRPSTVLSRRVAVRGMSSRRLQYRQLQAPPSQRRCSPSRQNRQRPSCCSLISIIRFRYTSEGSFLIVLTLTRPILQSMEVTGEGNTFVLSKSLPKSRYRHQISPNWPTKYTPIVPKRLVVALIREEDGGLSMQGVRQRWQRLFGRPCQVEKW